MDTVNFESWNAADAQSYDEGIFGVVKASGSFGGDWDANENPLINPPGLYPRDDLPVVWFVVNRLDATQWAFPYMRLRTVSNSTDVKAKVEFKVDNWTNQGPFTTAGGFPG